MKKVQNSKHYTYNFVLYLLPQYLNPKEKKLNSGFKVQNHLDLNLSQTILGFNKNFIDSSRLHLNWQTQPSEFWQWRWWGQHSHSFYACTYKTLMMVGSAFTPLFLVTVLVNNKILRNSVFFFLPLKENEFAVFTWKFVVMH